MFYPAVSFHNPNYAYVACDMTGSYVTYDGGLSWRMFSLRSPVKYFVFDPVDSNVIYAYSIALFKSSDRGNTWDIVYPVAEEIKGIVSKVDHAEERIITNDSTFSDLLALAVNPDNSNNLHAAISLNNKVAYYTSRDKGCHWIKEKDPGKIFIITFRGCVWHGPARGDENAVEDIVTPLLQNRTLNKPVNTFFW